MSEGQTERPSELGRMGTEIRALKDRADDIEPRLKNLRAELLTDLPPGMHVMGEVAVKISEQKRAPTIDWKKAFVDLNGQDALDDVLAKHKACAEAKPVYVLSVEWIGKKGGTPDEF